MANRLTQLARETLQSGSSARARLTQIALETLMLNTYSVLSQSGWIVTPSSTQSGFPASNAADGNLATYWLSSGSVPQSLTIDLGSSQLLGWVSIQPSTTTTANNPTGFTVSVSNDNVTYTQVAVAKGLQNNGSAKKVTFPHQSHRYVKVTVTSTANGTASQIAEVQMGVVNIQTFTPPAAGTYQLVPVDNIPGQQLDPYWNYYQGGTQQFSGGRTIPGGGAQSSVYNTPAANFAGGVNFPGGMFGGPYLYNGFLYALTADTLFTSIPSSNGPMIWQSPDGVTWTALTVPPTSGTMDWRNGWSAFWNPNVAANVITFRGYSFANAVDFNLDTLTWSAIYGTNSVPLNIYRGVVRLSDGRLRTISNDTSTPNIYFTTCSAGGTWGTQTSIAIVPAWTQPFNWDQGGIAVDGSDRLHSWWRFSQSSNQAGGTPPSPVTAYFNIDTTGVVTTQTGAPFDHSKATGAMLAADNVYVGAVGLSAANSVDVYVGVGLASPVWHTEQVAIGTFPPDHLTLQILNGLVTLGWQEQDSAQVTPMKLKLAQRSASGTGWSAPQTILDLATVQPVKPFTATSPVWIGQGFSFYPVPTAPNQIGLVSALDISPTSSSGTMSFALAPLSTGMASFIWLYPVILPDPQMQCCKLKPKLRCEIRQRGGVRAIMQTLKSPQYPKRV